MSFGLIYWIIMLLVAFGLFGWFTNQPWGPHAWGIALFVLLVLLGWHDFGPPVHT